MQAYRAIQAFAATRPLVFATTTATAKTAACDLMVQLKVEERETIDLRRLGIFAAFGFSFLGCWHYALFVKIMPRCFPGAETFAAKSIRDKLRDPAGQRAILGQLLLENGFNNAFCYFPCFYSLQAIIEGRPVVDGLRKWRDKFVVDVPSIWSWWVPVQTLNFSFSPLWMRVPVTTLASFVWTSYVSFSQYKPAAAEKAP